MAKRQTNMVCGLREVSRALRLGICLRLYVALDADAYVVRKPLELALKNDITIIEISDMKELGKIAGIDTKAALAAEIKIHE